jgi:hypothetical protein
MSNTHSKSTRKQIQEASTPAEVEAIFAKVKTYEFVSAKSKRRIARERDKRLAQLAKV